MRNPWKKYIARAKYLALHVKYHGFEVTEQEISRRVLNGLLPAYAPNQRNSELKTYFSLSDLESGLGWPRPRGRPQRELGRHPAKAGGAGDVETAMAVDAESATVKVAAESVATTAVSTAAPLRVARASSAAPAILATGAAKEVPAVSAATSPKAARTAFRGMWTSRLCFRCG